MAFTVDFVRHIADLARLDVDDAAARKLVAEFDESMAVVDELTKIDVGGVEPTYQVNNLVNVWREDVVDESSMFSQEVALQNAPRTYEGYFVVERVIDHET